MGGAPYSVVANGITTSDEYLGKVIDASYRTYLGRGADSGGKATWLAKIRDGWTIQEVQANLVASTEFYNAAGGTNSAWVKSLYTKVLGRTGSTSEVQGWVTALGNGRSRASVADAFIMSTEHLNGVVDGYYQDLLGRSADVAGRASWVTKLQSGTREEVIVAGIVSSQEYLDNL